jgi:hypothetical protein
VYTTNAINGRPAISFTGAASAGDVTQVLSNSSITVDATAGYSIFAVAYQNSSNPSRFSYNYILKGHLATDYYLFMGTGPVGGVTGYYATFTGTTSAWNDVNPNTPNISAKLNTRVYDFIYSPSSGTPYYDGTTMTAKAGTAASFTGMMLADTPISGGGQNWNGYLCEIIIYNYAVTAAERQLVEGYLAWKWGINASLAAGHPYQSSPPRMRIFQPTDLPGCALWIDPADRSTVTLSGNQPTAIVSKGQQAITADNVTPSGANYPAPTWTGYPPTGVTNYGTAFFNTNSNLNTLEFTRTIGTGGIYGNGNNGSYMRVPSITFSNQQRSVFFVHSPEATGIDNYAHIFSTTNWASGTNLRQRAYLDYTTYQYLQFPLSASGTQLIVGGNTAPFSGTMPTNGTPFIYAIRHTTSTSSNFMSINGNSLTLSTNQALSTGYTTETGEYAFGIFFAYTRQFIMGDLVVFDGALTDSQMRQMEGYLAWKWRIGRGTASTFPTSHPYYNLPPTTPLVVPTAITGCVLWLDAGDPSTLYSDSGGTTLASVGGTIGYWKDKSSSGKHYTQATAANRPSYSSTGTITFSGNGQLINASTWTTGVNYAIFAVVKPLSSTTTWRTMLRGATTDHPVLVESGSTRLGYYNNAGSGFNQFGSLTLDGTQVAILHVNISSTRAYTAALNGTLTMSSAATAGNADSQPFYFLGTVNSSQPWGDIKELIIYQATLDTRDRRRIEGYLAWKWGLRLNLPTTHSYYKFRP